MIAEDNERRRIADSLVLLSRASFTEYERSEIEDLFRRIEDWSLFSTLALRHGVAALIWQNIVNLGLERHISDSERTLLENARLRVISRVTFLTVTACEIAEELERRGIKALFLKGLALEHSVYGSRGLRQMSDIDILVSPENALMARDILTGMGFTSAPLKSLFYEKIILNIGNHLPEMHRSGITVDVHFSLFGSVASDLTRLALENPYNIIIGGRNYLMLPPGTAFLMLVSHILKHENKGEFQLRLYSDMFLLLNVYGREILNEKLIEEAELSQTLPELMRILLIMRKVFKLEISLEINPPEPEEVILYRFFKYMENPCEAVSLSREERYGIMLKSLPDPGKKLRFILGDIFPTLGFMKYRYGCKTVFESLVHYPHRLGKLIWVFRLMMKS